MAEKIELMWTCEQCRMVHTREVPGSATLEQSAGRTPTLVLGPADLTCDAMASVVKYESGHYVTAISVIDDERTLLLACRCNALIRAGKAALGMAWERHLS